LQSTLSLSHENHGHSLNVNEKESVNIFLFEGNRLYFYILLSNNFHILYLAHPQFTKPSFTRQNTFENNIKTYYKYLSMIICDFYVSMAIKTLLFEIFLL